MSTEDWFSSWFNSPYYFILYKNRDNKEAKSFIDKLVAYLNPAEDSKMLDIACGEGRHAVTLAAHGYDVTGIDISRKSILKAHEQETDKLHFFIQDMRLPFHVNYFDYAFNFFTSFGYFKSEREHLQAAKNIAQSIKKGGRFVIDYFNIHYVLQQMVADQHIVRGDFDFHVRKKLEDGKVIKNIRFTDPVTGDQKEFTEFVAGWDRAAIEQLFGTAGLTLVACFGNYELGEFNKEISQRLILIFEK